MKAKMSSKLYAQKQGVKCPVCLSDGGISGSSVEIDENGASQWISCSCGASWTDVYTLTGYVDLQDADGDPIDEAEEVEQ